jgi:hypothetical protein
MPDPAGAERLLTFGAKINWKKDWLEYPIKIKSQSDYRPGTKLGKLAKKSVWLISVNLPKTLVLSIAVGARETMNTNYDMTDLDTAYEKNFDKQGVFSDQTSDQISDDHDQSMGK